MSRKPSIKLQLLLCVQLTIYLFSRDGLCKDQVMINKLSYNLMSSGSSLHPTATMPLYQSASSTYDSIEPNQIQYQTNSAHLAMADRQSIALQSSPQAGQYIQHHHIVEAEPTSHHLATAASSNANEAATINHSSYYGQPTMSKKDIYLIPIDHSAMSQSMPMLQANQAMYPQQYSSHHSYDSYLAKKMLKVGLVTGAALIAKKKLAAAPTLLGMLRRH